MIHRLYAQDGTAYDLHLPPGSDLTQLLQAVVQAGGGQLSVRPPGGLLDRVAGDMLRQTLGQQPGMGAPAYPPDSLPASAQPESEPVSRDDPRAYRVSGAQSVVHPADQFEESESGSWSAEQLESWRQPARQLDPWAQAESEGWSLAGPEHSPTRVLEGFTQLDLRWGQQLYGLLHRRGQTRQARLLCGWEDTLPDLTSLPEPEQLEAAVSREDWPRGLHFAVMREISGSASRERYLQASLARRELEAWGQPQHQWPGCQVVEAAPGDQWQWEQAQPDSLAPYVSLTLEQVEVGVVVHDPAQGHLLLLADRYWRGDRMPDGRRLAPYEPYRVTRTLLARQA